MEIRRTQEVRTMPLPPDWASGTGWLDPIAEAPPPARARAVRLTFAPGARTAWHRHPLGQTLHVLSGTTRFQSRGGPLRELTPGDTVWIAPDEEHWHGAGREALTAHLAVYEAEADGTTTVWLEQVTDIEYAAAAVDD
jgi:quercetin dioxygenase-like cupin family protein